MQGTSAMDWDSLNQQSIQLALISPTTIAYTRWYLTSPYIAWSLEPKPNRTDTEITIHNFRYRRTGKVNYQNHEFKKADGIRPVNGLFTIIYIYIAWSMDTINNFQIHILL